MNKGLTFAVAVITATIAPLGACAKQNNSQPTTSPSSSAPPGAEKITTQLKSAAGSQVANATFDFTSGYATVTVEAGPNQVLSPGFHGVQIDSVGKCEANSAAPAGGSAGDFDSAGDVYQAPGHTGDPASGALTALQVRPDGSAKLVTTTTAFTAADLKNSLGTALVIYQDPGNFTSTGGSGKRVACGVISPAAATSTSSTTPTTVTTTVSTTAVPAPSTSTSTSTSTVTVTTTPSVTSTPSSTTTTGTTSNPPPGG